MATIGLIAAMAEECRPLLRRIQGWEKCQVSLFTGYRFQLAGSDCLLVQSGIGLKRGGEAAHALITAANPQLLISFGVAGGVNDNLQIGDVVSVHDVRLLEQGIPGLITPLATLTGPAQAAIAEALQPTGGQLVLGVALTTRGSQVVHVEPSNLENPVLEMETAAIAQAAAQSGVPLLGLRGISDNPSQPLPIDPDTVMDENYHLLPGKLLNAILRRPGIIFQANRLRRNTAIAAENTAIAVMSALNQDPVIQT